MRLGDTSYCLRRIIGQENNVKSKTPFTIHASSSHPCTYTNVSSTVITFSSEGSSGGREDLYLCNYIMIHDNERYNFLSGSLPITSLSVTSRANRLPLTSLCIEKFRYALI